MSKLTVEHTDQFSSDIYEQTGDSNSVDKSYSTSTSAAEPSQGGLQYELTSPANSVSELTRQSYLAKPVACRNRSRYQSSVTTFDKVSNPVENFALATTRTLPRAFDAEGISVAGLPIDRRYSLSLALKEGFRIADDEMLGDLIRESTRLYRELGFTSEHHVPGRSRFSQTRGTLRDADLLDPLARASVRGVYACYRQGIPIPESIAKQYPFGVIESCGEESSVPEPIEMAAVSSWAEYFRNNALDAFTFNRRANSSVSKAEFFGVLAHSALQSAGLSETRSSGRHIERGFPGGSNLLKHVESLSVDDIESQFESAYTDFFNDCVRMGVLDEGGSYNLAGDAVRFPFSGSSSPETISRPSPNPDELEIDEWTFVSVCIANPECRFVFGIPYVKSKDKFSTAFQRVLKTAEDLIDVQCLFLDREFAGTDIITKLKKPIGRRWVIHTPIYEDSDIEKKVKETEARRRAFKKVRIGDLNDRVNCYLHPTTIHGNKIEEAHDDPLARDQDSLEGYAVDGIGDKTTHKVYLTGLTRREFHDLAGEYTYQTDREYIETFFRQMKHGLRPLTESQKRSVQAYAVNAGALFFNYHTLANRVPDPEYGVPLNVSNHEFLTVFRNVLIDDSELPFPFDL